MASTKSLTPSASVSSSVKQLLTRLPNNRMIRIKIGLSKRKAVLFPNSKETERFWIIWIQRNQIILWSNKSFRLLLWEPPHLLRKTTNGNLILTHLKGEKSPSCELRAFHSQSLLLFKLLCPVPQDSCLSGRRNPA